MCQLAQWRCFVHGPGWLSSVAAEEPSSADWETDSRSGGRRNVAGASHGCAVVQIKRSGRPSLIGRSQLMSPISKGWWSGSVALGVEAAFLGIAEPTSAYGVGITPKVIYTFTSFGR